MTENVECEAGNFNEEVPTVQFQESNLIELNKQQSTKSIENLKYKKINKKFHRLFPINSNEKVQSVFSCALLRNNGHLLLQGRLYLTKRYFAFHSNIFGYQTSLHKKWSEVVNVEKDKIALVFPTAISIFTSNNEKYFFASFLSRNQAYRTICKIWNQSNNMNNNINISSDNNKKIILNREISVYMDAINYESEKFSTASTSNQSSLSSLIKISSSLSSSKSSLTSLAQSNPNINYNLDTSFDETDYFLKNNNKKNEILSSSSSSNAVETTLTSTNIIANEKNETQSFKTVLMNSAENLINFLISILLINKLQLFFHYMFFNSSINNFDCEFGNDDENNDYYYEYHHHKNNNSSSKSSSGNNNNSKKSSNFLNNFLVILTIIIIVLTLYIYIFLIFIHVCKIETQLSEIQKLFNT